MRPTTGQGPAPALLVLGEQEALDLAGTKPVGRIAHVHDDLPFVTPVNFLLKNGDVLFRTAQDSELLAAARRKSPAVLAVDDLANWAHSGWSVLIRGRLTEVLDPEQVSEILSSQLQPWAGGERDCVLRLISEQVTGRRIEPAPGGITVLHL